MMRLNIMDYLRSCYVWVLSALLVILFFPVLLIMRIFDRTPTHLHTGKRLRKLAVFTTRVNPLWKLKIKGFENVENKATYIVVSNHQSLTDIPLLCHLPLEMKWVAKKSLFNFPLLGWMMRLAGDIPVDVKSPVKKTETLRQANRYLHQNCSVMFFPEGKRSHDGYLGHFTNGAFELAIEAQVPVLPVVLDGLWDFLPPGSLIFGKAREIHLRVLPPIKTKGLNHKDAPYLREKTRTNIMDQLADWRQVTREKVDGIVRRQEEYPPEPKTSCPIFT